MSFSYINRQEKDVLLNRIRKPQSYFLMPLYTSSRRATAAQLVPKGRHSYQWSKGHVHIISDPSKELIVKSAASYTEVMAIFYVVFLP